MESMIMRMENEKMEMMKSIEKLTSKMIKMINDK